MNIKKFFAIIFACTFSINLFAQKSNQKSFKKDNILIEYVDYNGGVLLYYVDAKNQKVPVIDPVDFGRSSFTGLLVDKTYYNLKTSGDVKSKLLINEDSLSVEYTVGKKLVLTLTYSVPENNALNIQYSLKNISSEEHSVNVKSIFDTTLGEWNGTCFSTSAKQKIKDEYIVTNFQKHKYLISSDGVTGIRFILNKDFEKVAYKCVIAAKPFFENDSFDNHFIEGRGFNTILSYNNSCVGFFFKTRTLAPEEEISFSQKVEFAQAVITSFKEEPEDEEDEEKKYQEDKAVTPVSQYNPVNNFETINSQSYVEPVIKESKEPIEVKQQNESKESNAVPNFEQIPSTKNEEEIISSTPKVDRQRLLELVNRIKALESDGSNTSRRELEELNSEIDYILRQLKN